MSTNEKGFTLVEVMLALVILSVVMLGLAGATGALLSRTVENEHKTSAVQLLQDRVETILIDPRYGDLENNYQGSETSFPSLSGFQRVTNITEIGGEDDDAKTLKKVTVTVDGPGLSKPLSRTVVVAP